MARTRAKGAATAASKDDKKSATAVTKTSSSVYTLSTASNNPPKLFILPKSASAAARVVVIQHPRYNKPTRFLVCPEAGFFEFTTVSPPKSTPRSWLIQSTTPNQDDATNQSTQITQSPALHLATPYDPLFLLLPALYNTTITDAASQEEEEATKPPPTQKRMFLSLEDHLENTPDPSRHLTQLLATCATTRQLVEARLAAVCDTVQAGDERMFRVSEAKLLRALLAKARAVVQGGGRLPESMEERFVRKELEAPVLGVRVARGSAAVQQQQKGEEVVDGEGEDSVESQASVETVVSEVSEVSAASTAATSVGGEGDGAVSAMVASEEVVKLQRLRVAFNFICSSYVAPAIAVLLKRNLAQAAELVDFKPLDEYLERLAELRQEAAAVRSSDFSRKRAGDEEQDERAEKRRRQEAEEKAKKANMSRGVKNLMKVNTSGMKKMSDFFKKKA
ncbi:ribonuclease H2, subunit B [Chaetomium tenue]|uniref:Ribonuclease H2, subunit B n=1 Tax=Chaetomium tenue TaxID=1854479 RepID=A0ACB7NZH6_9PEZI|nr:ribonuclease H2, subunit B [Chaetomium globosum]